ncbi:MAG: hypothetical protein GC150_15405 [Rhizobiales bacterium]|nr:hypothetical protein [Hyphomicrobiales bacterium]
MSGLWNRFGAAWRAFTEVAPAPAGPSPFREAAGRAIEDEDEGWRRLTGDARRDLTPMNHARMLKLAAYLWEANPLANRLIELPVAYLVAEGVKLKVADQEAQGWLDAFWSDPINKMDVKLPRKVRELSLFGEQCYPAFVDASHGHVRLGYLDPAHIEKIICDPDNAEQPIGVVTTRDRKGSHKKFRVIVNGPEEVFTSRTMGIRERDFSDGECFLFRVNEFSAGARGRSDILAQIDWLDSYDQFLFGELERAKGLRAFFWDVTLAGATPEQVKERAAKITAPRSGGVRVHNDAEIWKTVSASLGAGDGAEAARMIRNHVLGGSTLPEHWYGGGGDVNRASAAEMGDPTYKMMAARQGVLKHMLVELGTYQVRQRLLAAGKDDLDPAAPEERYEVGAAFPEIVTKDLGRLTQALQASVSATAQAVAESLLSKKTAVAIIALAADRLGVAVDPEKELETAMRERADRRLDPDSDINPPPFARGDQGAEGAGEQGADPAAA